MGYNKLYYYSIPDNLYVAVAPEVSGAYYADEDKYKAYTGLDPIIDMCIKACKDNSIPLDIPLKELDTTNPSILDVASYIIKHKNQITTYQLQKLCYYCKVWSLIWFNKPLFTDNFEAWVDGPVSRKLFNKHKGYRTVYPTEIDYPHTFSTSETRFINCILQVYGVESGEELSALTHYEDAWNMTREGLAEDAFSDKIITDEIIKQSYSLTYSPSM